MHRTQNNHRFSHRFVLILKTFRDFLPSDSVLNFALSGGLHIRIPQDSVIFWRIFFYHVSGHNQIDGIPLCSPKSYCYHINLASLVFMPNLFTLTTKAKPIFDVGKVQLFLVTWSIQNKSKRCKWLGIYFFFLKKLIEFLSQQWSP